MPDRKKPPQNDRFFDKGFPGPPWTDNDGVPQPVDLITGQPVEEHFLNVVNDEDYGLLSDAQKAEDGFFYLLDRDSLQQETTHEEVTGLIPLPVAGIKGTFCKVGRVHANYWLKRVIWRVRRIGAKPKLPDADTQNDNEVLLKRTITQMTPALMRDETSYLYDVRGEYVYLLLCPPDLTTDLLDVGTTPAVKTPAGDHALVASQWDNELLKSTPPAAFTAAAQQGSGNAQVVE